MPIVANINAGKVQISKTVGSNRNITASEGAPRSHQQRDKLK